MGVFTRLFGIRDKPENRTVGSAFRPVFGNSSAGKLVTERSAMQMTAIYACVRILAESIAGLPLHVYQYNSKGGKEKAAEHHCFFFCTMNQILR